MFDAAVIRRRIYFLLSVLVMIGGILGALTFQLSIEVQNVTQTVLGVFSAGMLLLLLQRKVPLQVIEWLSLGMYMAFWVFRFAVEIVSPHYRMGAFPLHSDTGLTVLVLLTFISLPTFSAMRVTQVLYLVFIFFPWLVLAVLPERRLDWVFDDFFRVQLITTGMVGLVYVLGVYKEQWVREQERSHWLHQIASTDLLTGALNRRRLYEVMEGHLEGSQFSVILFDLDHFKRINDRYGHATGDAVLRKATEAARDVLRPSDHIGRWGGEEFLVVLPSTTLQEALELAEHMRTRFLESAVHELPGFSASFGVAEHMPQETHDAMVHRADQALYQAKACGRNCVVPFGEHVQLSGTG
ncbi:GGDEF domain-containing protein [Deinococcus cellulosilyticus]|uniref:GGDEF domain-containing protein n=1 Tax=Deinococcus cellulosilyticus (strain DSM 18568 / NBRC 106333 / KACC 11606 / 5516J-15) TaxID=1223518 RepID=A0A511N259_DEIC1|nr:GGDEF domain-containing protein [Deinococcus cellulosilyticus]GEM46548.1 hypothetical protein DC3_21830 [Deinococcus cellulosilyticus NBRC 106333 = KACC 11606]